MTSETVTQRDMLDPTRANALLTSLGRTERLVEGEALPPFFHHLYFWEPHPPDALGRDGHPKVGGLIPDLGLPRRMWAGGALQFLAPLRVGREATKTSRVVSVTEKHGQSGPLGFVTLEHLYEQQGQVCVQETQNLVYREDPSPDAPKPAGQAARQDEMQSEQVDFSSTLLFRYSALTFNGHRIHYDLDYAREVEGYSGLVVHGPLLAQLLMLMVPQTTMKAFRYRGVSPLMHHETATLCRCGDDLWVLGPDGRLILSATAET